MRRSVWAALPAVALLGVLSACGPLSGSSLGSGTGATTDTTTPNVALPPAPQPGAAHTCPYLKSDFVSDANGEKVGTVRLSDNAADGQPYPSCFFYRYTGGLLGVTVRIYVGDPQVAQALVNQAAPISTSNPAREPVGWQGGYESTNSGAVYAIAKASKAVIVTTNQAQTIKARQIATQAITTLGW